MAPEFSWSKEFLLWSGRHGAILQDKPLRGAQDLRVGTHQARCPQPTSHSSTQLPDQPRLGGCAFLWARLLWRSLPRLSEAWVTLTPCKGAHDLPQNCDPRGSTTEETRWERAVTSRDPYRGPGSTLPVPHTMMLTEPFYCFKGFSLQFNIVHLQTLRYMNLDQLLNLWKKR